MKTHHHNRSEVPTPVVVIHNPSSVSAQQQQVHGETANGLSLSKSKSYPSATATYEQVAQSSDLFWEKLKAFHASFGTKFM